jgi:dTDP-4-dehydrorhamnose reductase
MNVAIIGANGQLGTDLTDVFTKKGHTVHPLTIDDILIEDENSVKNVLHGIKPDVVLNAAAFHNVPLCEDEPAKAFAVNALGALNIARITESLGCLNVYYSTDYVFDGKKGMPYVETDLPNPLNVYAASKLAGEYLTLNYSLKSLVIRISGIYGKVPSMMKGNNFITSILKAAKEKPHVEVVTDEILTPTPTEEIAEKTEWIVQSGATGLFHLTSEGECSWYEFTKVIFETLKIQTPLIKTTSSKFASPVKRPMYSVLDNVRYNALPKSEKMRFWKDALISFLKKNYPS